MVLRGKGRLAAGDVLSAGQAFLERARQPGVDQAAVKRDAAAYLQRSLGAVRVEDYCPRMASLCVQTYAALSVRADAWFEAMAFVVEATAGGLRTPKLLARLVWGLAKNVDEARGAWPRQGAVFGILCARLRDEEVLDAFSWAPQDVANVAWGLAAVAHRDDALLDALAARALRIDLEQRFCSQAAANTLWGFATLRRPHVPLFQRLAAQLAAAARSDPTGFPGRHAAAAVTAIGECLHGAGGELRAAFDTTLAAVIEVPMEEGRHAANVLRALAKTSRDGDGRVVDVVAAKALPFVPGMSGRDLVDVVAAARRLRGGAAPLLAAAAERLAGDAAARRGLSGQDMHTLLREVAQLHREERAEAPAVRRPPLRKAVDSAARPAQPVDSPSGRLQALLGGAPAAAAAPAPGDPWRALETAATPAALAEAVVAFYTPAAAPAAAPVPKHPAAPPPPPQLWEALPPGGSTEGATEWLQLGRALAKELGEDVGVTGVRAVTPSQVVGILASLEALGCVDPRVLRYALEVWERGGAAARLAPKEVAAAFVTVARLRVKHEASLAPLVAAAGHDVFPTAVWACGKLAYRPPKTWLEPGLDAAAQAAAQYGSADLCNVLHGAAALRQRHTAFLFAAERRLGADGFVGRLPPSGARAVLATCRTLRHSLPSALRLRLQFRGRGGGGGGGG